MGFGLWPTPALEHSPVSEAIMKVHNEYIKRYRL